jgi:hypothetical protein
MTARVTVLAVASLEAALVAVVARDLAADDLVVIHPEGGALVAGTAAELTDAAAVFEGAIAVAAMPSAEFSGVRSTPYALGLCGPAKAVRELLHAAVSSGGSDHDRLLAAVEDGGHDVVLDSGVQFFVVLDGTGTDVVATAGRLFAGGERPVVAIDPTGRGALVPLRAALDDEGGRDLVRLLRYEAASTSMDEHPGVAGMAAPDIIVGPFWTPEFCATVIRAAEAAGIWAADPDDPVPGAEVSLLSVSPRLVALLDEDLRARLWPELREHWPEVAITPIADVFVIRYEAGGAVDELPLHHDVAQVSAAIRLNDGYDGGALEFPRQAWDNHAVPVGAIVAWPSLVTHPHRSTPVTRGVKYGLTIWFDLPGN